MLIQVQSATDFNPPKPQAKEAELARTPGAFNMSTFAKFILASDLLSAPKKQLLSVSLLNSEVELMYLNSQITGGRVRG